MNKRKIISRQIPLMILWLMASFLLWGFVLNLLTDTRPEHKLVIFAEMKVPDGTGLAVELEKEKPEGIAMVRVHPFTYAMMDGSELANADLYLIPESDFAICDGWFAPVPEALREGRTLFCAEDGEAYGILVSEGADAGIDYGWLRYEGQEPVYLAFGAHSLHLQDREKAVDNAAAGCAERLLELLKTN